MPIGWNKGVKLKDIPTKDLEKTRQWCAEKDDEAGADRWTDLINDIDEVLADRKGYPLGL
jgi:hypothetical protein